MPRSVALFLLLLLAPLARAGDPPAEVVLYRYTDSKGEIVLDREGVPSEYIAKGYQVLNAQGRVIRVIPPALSPEEMQRQSDAKAAAKVQATSDAQLMRLYSNVTDVDMAKSRKFAELDALIAVAQSNLQALRVQQGVLQGQAADQERAGHDVAEHLLEQINGIKDDEQVQIDSVARYQAARTQAEASFNADRVRLAQLQGGQ